MVNIWVPPHCRSGGAINVPVGQHVAMKGPQNCGETSVESQHSVQVEGEHFNPVISALDQGAAALLTALTVGS